MRLKPKEYFEKAVEICPEEPSVLETCGQFARYRGELDLSETLLRKALQIKPTCHAYHHLALTLTRRVTGRSYKGQSERIRLRQMTKSPLEVFVYPENELLVEAINLLEKTEKLSVCWFIIQYDKGIIYRMLGQIEKAVKVFKQIVSKKKNLPIKLLMTIVYEQLGLCLIELSKCDEISPDIQQRYKRDGQAHLLHAIQLQPEIVANDPQFKEAWNSYPTLKELFSDERDGKPRQLAVLHMRMGNHRDAIDIYKKLYLKENDKMKPEDCVNMLKCYQKEGQLEECVFLLRSWECTTLFSGLPPSLIFDVYIDCAFHAYTTDNAQLAYQHFRRAFKVYGMFDKPNDKQTTEEDENTKEILILHSCALKWKCKHPRNLGTILEDVTGLRYTINSDDVLPNALVQESMVTIIQKMACIIIMTHDSAEVYDKLYVNLAIRASSGKSGPQVLVVSDDERHMPDIASTKSFIRIPPPLEGAMDQNKQISEEHREWIKEFITKITDLS
ncbi:uncharacterized protein LOC110450523 [Mizuhopecten yessoensis]|uniref:uncharacterized protein LOC110450523 n=1 Tax=Mizuhopecten yessoensis TaxID=6573 RepID=UPI000B458B2C|nr:uncharacterized protein LOC110450523 [Mizuhopecten yessoensis]XP_021353758.1 uncharacterized protein LOC110450523 [Mizuhopecten yessoensis]